MIKFRFALKIIIELLIKFNFANEAKFSINKAPIFKSILVNQMILKSVSKPKSWSKVNDLESVNKMCLFVTATHK